MTTDTRPRHHHETGDYLVRGDGRCWFCGGKAEQEQGGEVKTEDATISFQNPDGTQTEPISMDQFRENAERLIRGVDTETGEVSGHPGQLEMTGHEAFVRPVPKRSVTMVKVGLTGGAEITSETFADMIDGRQLAPGLVCYARVKCFLPAPHTEWVRTTVGSGENKDVAWLLDGRVKLKVVEVEELEVTREVWRGEDDD